MKENFRLGKIVITCNADERLNTKDVLVALRRHANGDWGDVCAEDGQLNDEALTDGNRILSVYRDSRGTKFWIITEADRSATTVLLPEDY